MQRPRDGDGAMVATIGPNSLQEGRCETSTRRPRFRSWRPARCLANLQRSGISVVKLRQDSQAQPSQKTVKTDETNDLHSLRGPCRDLRVGVFFPAAIFDK